MQKIVAAVTREKSRLQAACDLLKEEVSELKDDNAVLQEQITFLGASAMDHESIQTPSHTSSLFAQLSEELAGPEPPREHAEPSGEEESTEASAPGALDETEAPKFIRPWQPPPATRKLQEAARAARRAAGGGGAKSDSRVGKAENAQLTFRAAQRPQPGEASTRTTSAGTDASALVRRKILETIKRGIAANSDRTDLEEGERRMLEHMQLYVMETSVAESQLSDDEAEAWEQMKASYLRGTKEQA